MRRSPMVLVAAAAVVLLARGASAAPEEARPRAPRAPVPLDGIAAIVDDVFIFRSEVVHRARHFEERLSKNPIERRAELVTLHKELLARMIDEILVAKDAARLHVEVTDVEVNQGLLSVAAQNKVDKAALEAEVLRQGYTLPEYREDIRRRIAEQKWLVIRVSTRIDRKKATDEASLTAEYEKYREKLLVELRQRSFIEIR